MAKRLFDITVSAFLLVFFSPLIVVVLILIWIQDWHNPFYIANRVGIKGEIFKMYKFRSMIVNAESSGVDSTGNNDARITKVGHFIRNYKLDELSQMFNVFLGNMSLVGPRPNVKRETDLYSTEEKKILNIKPGVTDLSSIVFADEGQILADKKDPDIAYNQLIRPYKSELAILYVEHQNFLLDLKILILTALTFLSREKSLEGVSKIVENMGGNEDLVEVCKRKAPLIPKAPPGHHRIIETRDI